MEQDRDVLASLMTGLPEPDRSGLLEAIRDAQREQLDRKMHPPRRRRRNADGVLVDPPAGAEGFDDESSADVDVVGEAEDAEGSDDVYGYADTESMS